MLSKKEKTKQKIIDSFWSLYETKRIEKITVRDICTVAEINRSTFYDYFSDVYHVLETIEDSLIPTEYTLPPIQLLDQSSIFDPSTQLAFFNTNKKYLKVLLSENGNPAFRFKLMHTVKPLVIALFEGHSKPPHFDYIVEYAIWGMIGVLSYHIQNEDKSDEASVLLALQQLSSRLLTP